MITDLKPYAEYKDSGLPWLGRIPAQWELLRSKYLFREVDQRSITGEETRLSMSQKLGLIPSSQIEEHRLVSENYVGAKICEAGYLVLNRLKAHLGVFALASERGLVSPDYTVFRPTRPMEAKYFEAFYRTPECRIELRRRAKGIVEGFWRLYTDDFYDICAPVPSQDEQAAIMRFLNYASQRLERMIRAKRKVIALLNEQKQAIIHRAVTRGLDPNVTLKPSGIPWLGEIPAHWELRRFKFLGTINSGQIDPRRSPYRDMVLIAPNHIESGTGKLLCEETASEQGADSGKYLVRKGQVIYSKIRPNLRKVAIAPCDCLCSADMYPISPKLDELTAEYFLRLLLSQPFTKYVVDCSMRVAMPKVNRDALSNCWLWIPPLDEQSRVLESVEREIAPFDTVITRTEREIALLREYRTRLIADVVTGKLDVREAARQLPREADEPESLMESDTLDEGEESFDGDVEMIAGDAEDGRE